MTIKKFMSEAVGWYGTIAIVLAFALISFEVITATSLTYQILNGTGALGLMYISFYKKIYQPAVLNLVWLIIAFIATIKVVV